MRNYLFPLAAVLAMPFAFPLHAAGKPRPAQESQNQPKKIWTNEDMDQLRARGLISIVGPEETAQAPAPPAAEQSAGPTFPVYESRLDDPEWYAQKVADLQAELDKRLAALQQQQDALANAKDRVTQPGLALDQPDAGVTPAAGLVNLQAQVDEVQNQLDELGDLARQHDIDLGVLRS